MKEFIISIFQFLFKPVVSNPKNYVRIRDIVISSSSEHLYRLVEYIEKNESDFQNKVIVDVGSADGSVALFFNKTLKPREVICFDPNPAFWNKYEAMPTNIRLIKKALSNISEIATFNVTRNLLSSSLLEINESEILNYGEEHQRKFHNEGRIEVEASTLDCELEKFNEIFVLKLDTQGTELDILKGGSIILENTSYVVCEMQNHQLYTNSCQYYEVDSFLRKAGFDLIDIIVSYRSKGKVEEFDTIYKNSFN